MAYNTIEMLRSTNTLLREIVKIPAVQNLIVMVNSAINSCEIVGAATILSGKLAGPLGAAIGGVISSILVGYFTQGTYRSAPDILINGTTPAQRENLAATLWKYFRSIAVSSIPAVVKALQSNAIVMHVMEILTTFLTSAMGLSVLAA